jgi:hypothetical protein
MKRLAIILAILCASCFGQPWSGIIASSRAMDWTQAGAVPGSPGSLPDASWTQCGTTLAAGSYNGSTIASTLSGCPANTYYLLGAGTFSINGSISMPGGSGGGYRVLRGMGANQTILNFSGTINGCNGASADICISGDGSYPGQPITTSNAVQWTAGYAQGATTITLSSVSGITINKTLLVLNQCDTGFSGLPTALGGNNCGTGSSVDNGGYFFCSTIYNATGPVGCGAEGPDSGAWTANDFEQELVLVTAINAGGCGATCVTISHPLFHPNWSSGQSPFAILVQPAFQDGIENLTINASASGASSQAGIGIQDCYECWVSGVAILDAYVDAIYLNTVVAHTTVQQNYIFQSNGNSDAYAIRPVVADSDLIQNNIIQQWKNSIACDGPCVGEVIAYNFSVDQIVPGPTDQMWGMTWTHAAGDDFMLREGNEGDQAQDDNVHGTHLNQTGFRNFFWGFESCINGTTGGSNCGTYSVKDESSTAFVESSGVRYANNVANVLGTPGFTTTYQSSAPFSAYAAWNMGGGNAIVSLPTDPLVASTMLRWGNYDVVNNAVLACTANGSNSWPGGSGSVCTEDERGDTAPTYPGLSSPSTTLPASFYMSGRPAWWSVTIPYPAIGPDVSSGNIGQCGGTIDTTKFAGLPATKSSQCASGQSLNTAWAGHVNAIPAMSCYLNVMGGVPDGTGNALTFNANTCYGSTQQPAVVLVGNVQVKGNSQLQ